MKRLINMAALLLMGVAGMKAETFSIVLDIDNVDAVVVAVDGQIVAHEAGLNDYTASAMVEVGVTEGYVFSQFVDSKGVDHLQYNNQKMPVVIRDKVSVGMGETVSNDGLTFTVRTKDENEGRDRLLTVNVNDASQVELKIGSSLYFTSSSNRVVDLKDGANNVYYSADEKYALLSGVALWKPLESVKFDDKEVAIGDDYVYLIRLPEEGGSLDIVAKVEVVTPPEETCTFTLSVDDVDRLKYFTQEGNPEKELLGTLSTGDNIIRFAEGTRFSIWPTEDPLEITLDGETIEKNPSYNVYYFTPSDNSVVNVRFTREASDTEYIVKVVFANPDTEDFLRFMQVDDVDFPLSEFIEGKGVKEGSEVWFSYRNFDYVINDISLNGVSRGPNYPGALLFNVYEDTEVVFDVYKPKDITFTVIVDDAAHLVAYTGNYYDPLNVTNTLELSTGNNVFTVPEHRSNVKFAPVEGFCIVSLTDAEGNVFSADVDGICTVDVVEGMVLDIKTSDTNGIDSADCTPQTLRVYNLQGILLNVAATSADLQSLPAGLYIVNGRKISIKH